MGSLLSTRKQDGVTLKNSRLTPLKQVLALEEKQEKNGLSQWIKPHRLRQIY